ncbi:hypothetical protein QVM41_08985 [Pseudomonas shirazica]|uniref:hypothetical protein n=1 Tax=Pseudomonas shirazica TaxID=1940636 RepID=UPI0035246E07
MSKVIEFPQAPEAVVVNEEFFEKFADAALLMMCFESVADAVEVVGDGVKIHDRDEIHVKLIEACMALAVLFRRRTGHDVQQVSADHLDEERRCLLSVGCDWQATRKLLGSSWVSFSRSKMTAFTIAAVTRKSPSITRKRIPAGTTAAVAEGPKNQKKTQQVMKMNPNITLTKNH